MASLYRRKKIQMEKNAFIVRINKYSCLRLRVQYN
jgi:hypothetical protein